MAKQEIRDFPDFEGESTEGYIIVGGKTASVEGGKKLLSDVIPNVPAADEETITNDNGTLKVKEPVPPHEEHDNALLCVNWDGEVKWTDDLEDPISVEEVWKSICATKDLEKFTNYPLEINASGGVALITNENTQIGAVLTVVPNDSDEQSFDWVLPPEQVQADWEQDDTTAKDYIKNKPDVSNKIESISIADTKLVPDENKNVNINLTNGGLTLEQCILKINTGTGGLYVNDGVLDIHCEYPLINNPSSDGKCIKLSYDDSTLLTGDFGLEVANPVPDTDNANDGDVLTFSGDDIVWAAPQGGGGGGNPYTKTTIAATDATVNGHQTSYGTDFYDQSITINNNSYTIVSNVAYGMVEDYWGEVTHEVVSVENFTINLAQTDFPLAVVEFTLDEKAAVVNIHVNNGSTPLTRMYSTPYVNALMPSNVDDDTGKATLSFDTGTIQNGSNYYYIKGIYSYQLSQNKPSLVTEQYAEVYTKVVIKIFGDTFTVLTNNYNADIPAS